MSESFMPGEHRGYRREEIEKLLLGVGDSVRKLYALVAKDSGLRAHHLGKLRYEHLADEIDRSDMFVFLKLGPEFYPRRKPAGRTFIGPEAVDLLRQLVQVGRIKKNPTSPILDVTYQTITHDLRDARDEAGLDKQIQPSHGLRKFFDNSLDKADLNSNVQNLLEGRGLGVRGWHYTDRNVDELREAYKKAYPFLRLVSKPENGVSKEQLEKLSDQLSKLRKDLLIQQIMIDELAEQVADSNDEDHRADRVEDLKSLRKYAESIAGPEPETEEGAEAIREQMRKRLKSSSVAVSSESTSKD
jgi:hypothetical protein